MDRRIEFHDILTEILGTKNVYYQPPETIKMKYPCIVYDLSRIDSIFALNHRYTENRRYSVTLIDRDPDSVFFAKLMELPYCSFSRAFTTDNLNHFVFEIYY